jgi:hypothetical protein
MLRLSTIGLAGLSLLLLGAGLARADGLLANWTLNDGGAAGNTIGAGATIADSSGNGFKGTVAGGSDTLQSLPGVIGNGLYFSGDDSSNYSYISVPATLANGTNLGGMNSLTISLWVNIPAPSYNNPMTSAVDLYTTGDECYEVNAEYGNLGLQKGLVYSFNGGLPSPIATFGRARTARAGRRTVGSR